MAWWDYGTIPGLQMQLEIRFDGSTWVDVTPYMREYATSISRSRVFGVFSPGLGSFTLDNRTGRFTPRNASGPYFGQLLPGRHLRYREKWNGVEYWVWYGIVTDWGDSFPQANLGWATVTTEQPTALLAGVQQAAVATPVGANELTSARISRWLTLANWSGSTSIATGYVPCQATDLSDDAMSGIAKAVDAELGAAWCEPSGQFVFENRYALAVNSRSRTSQHTFGPSAGQTPYISTPDLSSGLDLVINQVTAGNVGQEPVTLSDSTSISSLQSIRSKKVTNLIGTDPNWAKGNAAGLLRLYGTPYQHPRSITVAPNASPSTAFPQVLGRRIRDRVTVNTVTPWGATLACQCWIVGISHRGRPTESRRTVFEFEPADALTGVNIFTLDSSSLDGPDILGW